MKFRFGVRGPLKTKPDGWKTSEPNMDLWYGGIDRYHYEYVARRLRKQNEIPVYQQTKRSL